MKQLGRVIDSIVNVGGYFSGWLVPLMMLLVLAEVFMRYVMHQPPLVADEFSAYMLVALSFLGAAYTWKEKGLVRITALVSRLPPMVSSWLRLIMLVLAFIFVALLSNTAYHYLTFSFKFNMSSASHLQFPLQGPQMSLIIGFVLLSLLLIVEIARAIVNIRSGKSVEEADR